MTTTNAQESSELQAMIADSINRLFEERVTAALRHAFDQGDTSGADALWQQVAEMGLTQALVPAEAGGSGASWQEAWPVFRALGFWQAPLPLAETMLASLLLARAGIAIPDGPITLIEASQQGRLTHHDQHLNGTVLSVPWASRCRWAVVSTTDAHLALVDLSQGAAVRIDAVNNLAALPHDTVTFTDARIAALTSRPFAFMAEPVWNLGAMARAAMLVGALEAVLTTAVEHANTRVQFGKPLGKFQAIQQSLAEVASTIGAARIAAQVAFHAAPVDETPAATLAFDIAVAKVRTGEAATLAAKATHQVLGAIGFTREHTLHFATRRLWSWRAEFGSDAAWAELLGKAAIAAGTHGFWKQLTERHL